MRTNYQNGSDKERKILNDNAKKYGYKNKTEANQGKEVILIRSAGSHSPVDCIIIHRETKFIEFIQAKPNTMSENKKTSSERL